MTKRNAARSDRWIGLIAGGRVIGTFLTRLPNLARHLGPIRSESLRVSARAANSLRAGFPVSDYGSFQSCRLILIAVPRDDLDPVLADLAQAGFSWHGKSVVLCDDTLDSSVMTVLASRGASVASLWSAGDFAAGHFYAEGDAPAILELRRWIQPGRGSIHVVGQGAKALFLAGRCLAGPMLLTQLQAGVACFRAAGLTPHAALFLCARSLHGITRSVTRLGRQTPQAPDPVEASLIAAALHRYDPALAQHWGSLQRLTSGTARTSAASAGS